MSGKYLLDTNVAIRVLNQELDLQERRGTGIAASAVQHGLILATRDRWHAHAQLERFLPRGQAGEI